MLGGERPDVGLVPVKLELEHVEEGLLGDHGLEEGPGLMRHKLKLVDEGCRCSSRSEFGLIEVVAPVREDHGDAAKGASFRVTTIGKERRPDGVPNLEA